MVSSVQASLKIKPSQVNEVHLICTTSTSPVLYLQNVGVRLDANETWQ